MVVISNKRYTIKRNTKSLLKYQKNKNSTNKNKRTKKKSVNQVGHVGQVGSGFFFTSKYAKDIKPHTTTVVSDIIKSYYNILDYNKNKYSSIDTNIKKQLEYINTTYRQNLSVCLSKCISGILQYFYKSDILKELYKKKYNNMDNYNPKSDNPKLQESIKKIITRIFTNLPNPNPNNKDEKTKEFINELSSISKGLNTEINNTLIYVNVDILKIIIQIKTNLEKHRKYICKNKNTFIDYCIEYIKANISQQGYYSQW